MGDVVNIMWMIQRVIYKVGFSQDFITVPNCPIAASQERE